jgi:hypothetical protein
MIISSPYIRLSIICNSQISSWGPVHRHTHYGNPAVLPGTEIVFRPVHQKNSANFEKRFGQFHKNVNATYTLRVNSQWSSSFSLTLKVCQHRQIRNFFRKYSSAPFLPLLMKFGENSATNSSGQFYFSSAPFELNSRNFGHLEILESSAKLCTVLRTFLLANRSEESQSWPITESGLRLEADVQHDPPPPILYTHPHTTT